MDRVFLPVGSPSGVSDAKRMTSSETSLDIKIPAKPSGSSIFAGRFSFGRERREKDDVERNVSRYKDTGKT